MRDLLEFVLITITTPILAFGVNPFKASLVVLAFIGIALGGALAVTEFKKESP